MKSNVLNIYGCSFTDNFKTFGLDELFSEYEFHNYGKESSNNFYILNKFEETAPDNSTAIIQWSSLTRIFDENYSILETSDNPLYDYLNQWYSLLDSAQKISKERNIKLIQYIGWAQWKDEELNDYHRNKLNSYGIHWFYSKKQFDIIADNCVQLQDPEIWSSREVVNGLHVWSELKWGGMSEWCRSNFDMNNRYRGNVIDGNGVPHFDVHPSKECTEQFIKQFILMKLKN